MKRAGKFALSFVGGILCLNSVLAANVGLPGNPYTVVVERNIFGLNPAPLVDPNAAKAPEPPVKIIPNGIMTIFGQLQVLFKVAAKPPAKDESYIFTEGQSQDDIEVVKINEKAGIVTFNNHGIVQDLALVATPASSAAAPASTGSAPIAHVPIIASRANPASYNAASQIPKGMTPEVQSVAIEVNRELTKQQVMNGELPPLPITDITPSDAVGAGGAALNQTPQSNPPN